MYITHRTASPSATVSGAPPAAPAPPSLRASSDPNPPAAAAAARVASRTAPRPGPAYRRRGSCSPASRTPRRFAPPPTPPPGTSRATRGGATGRRTRSRRGPRRRDRARPGRRGGGRTPPARRVAVVSNRHVEHRARDERRGGSRGLPHPARVRVRGGVRLRARRRRARGGLAPGELGKARAGARRRSSTVICANAAAPVKAESGAARDQGVHVRARGRASEGARSSADAVGLRPEVLAVPRAREAVMPPARTLPCCTPR